MRARAWIAFSLLFAAVGCATHLYGESMRGVDLEARHRVHVLRHAQDKLGIDRMIAARLMRAGFEATFGPEAESPPTGVQSIVTYEDHWMWDMENYILTLRIDFRDPETNELLASGQSYRTSTARKSADFMVDEVVTAILAGS